MTRTVLSYSLALFTVFGCSGSAEKGPGEGLTDADGDGWTAGEDDCDDTDAYVHPDAAERCDGADDDCDGDIDEGVSVTFYDDLDGDGFGDPASAQDACARPEGAAAVGTDCDDADTEVHPYADELCDGLDNDCDGLIDDADDALSGATETLYVDQDGDGYGDPDATGERCAPGEGYVENSADCDDDDASVSPEGVEICDERDNDCDSLIDDQDTVASGTTTAYTDADADGYGDPDAPVQVCALGLGAVADATDCDDAHADAHPGGTESCRGGVDEDCDGEIDESCAGCGDLSIIQYYDTYTSGSTPLDEAADILGGVTLSSTTSIGSFTSTFDAGTWDVLVLDIPAGTLSTSIRDRMYTAITDGTVVIVTWWYLYSDTVALGFLDASVSTTTRECTASPGT